MADAVNRRRISYCTAEVRNKHAQTYFVSRKFLPAKIFCWRFCHVITGMTLPLAACNEQDTAATEQTFGPSPTLPAPENSLIPTVNVAKAIGWPAGGKPVAANGMAVNAFATGLDHPRRLFVLPNGDVLVAETNAPPKPDDTRGIKGWITKTGHGPRRRRYAERQSHHAAARRQWRRRRRDQERFSAKG